MKLVLLVENNSLYDTFFHAEHGFSAYIEDEGKKVLYDTGYSDAFIKNAEQMGIDLTELDYVIVSHGHYDHAGGVKHLIEYYRRKKPAKKPVFLSASEDILLYKYNFEVDKETGFDVDLTTLQEFFDVQFVSDTMNLTSRLIYLGQVERLNDFECKVLQNKKMKNNEYVDDYIDEDTQLVFRHKSNEISIVTGCSHNGICNIMSYAKKVTGIDTINSVVGGLHLQDPSDYLINSTLDYIKEAKIKNFYACHDTDFESKLAIAKVANIRETGVSLTFNWE